MTSEVPNSIPVLKHSGKISCCILFFIFLYRCWGHTSTQKDFPDTYTNFTVNFTELVGITVLLETNKLTNGSS